MKGFSFYYLVLVSRLLATRTKKQSVGSAMFTTVVLHWYSCENENFVATLLCGLCVIPGTRYYTPIARVTYRCVLKVPTRGSVGSPACTPGV